VCFPVDFFIFFTFRFLISDPFSEQFSFRFLVPHFFMWLSSRSSRFQESVYSTASHGPSDCSPIKNTTRFAKPGITRGTVCELTKWYCLHDYVSKCTSL